MSKAIVAGRSDPKMLAEARDLDLISLAPMLTMLVLLVAFFVALIESPRQAPQAGDDLMLMSGP